PQNKTGDDLRRPARARERARNLCFLGLVLLCLSGATGPAGEIAPDGRDHPLLARFPGSVIAYYAERNYDEFILPLDSVVEEFLPVEGRVTQIQYRLE